jgi:hypothetical protein
MKTTTITGEILGIPYITFPAGELRQIVHLTVRIAGHAEDDPPVIWKLELWHPLDELSPNDETIFLGPVGPETRR